MTTSIQKWGNSQGVRLPKIILDEVKFSENEEIDITTEGDKIIITKVKNKPRKNIMQLFEGYEGEYKSEEIDWGQPQGKEIW